jgi:hypothetical protein
MVVRLTEVASWANIQGDLGGLQLPALWLQDPDPTLQN